MIQAPLALIAAIVLQSGYGTFEPAATLPQGAQRMGLGGLGQFTSGTVDYFSFPVVEAWYGLGLKTGEFGVKLSSFDGLAGSVKLPLTRPPHAVAVSIQPFVGMKYDQIGSSDYGGFAAGGAFLADWSNVTFSIQAATSHSQGASFTHTDLLAGCSISTRLERGAVEWAVQFSGYWGLQIRGPSGGQGDYFIYSPGIGASVRF